MSLQSLSRLLQGKEKPRQHKQASLTGCPTTLEQKRSFRPRFGSARP